MINLADYVPWLPFVAIIAAIVLGVLWITDNMDFLVAVGTWFTIVIITIVLVWTIRYALDQEWFVYDRNEQEYTQCAKGIRVPKGDLCPEDRNDDPDDPPVVNDSSANNAASSISAPVTGGAETTEDSNNEPVSEGDFPQCREIQSSADAARILGGSANDWAEPDWISETSQGAFKYVGPRVKLTFPGFGYFDTPGKRRVQSDVTVDDASFHCEEPRAA